VFQDPNENGRKDKNGWWEERVSPVKGYRIGRRKTRSSLEEFQKLFLFFFVKVGKVDLKKSKPTFISQIQIQNQNFFQQKESTFTFQISNMDYLLSVDNQTKDIIFKAQSHDPTVFSVNLREGALGPRPMARVNFTDLPKSGKHKIRGIDAIQGKNKKVFKKLKMGLDKESGGDVMEMCRRVLTAWNKDFSPVSRSMWYQSIFDLEDGTKVHSATQHMLNPVDYNNVSFDGKKEYQAPSRTFGPALYGDESNKWYVDVTVPEPYLDGKSTDTAFLYLYDENSKKIKTRTVNGTVVYPTSGIDLADNDKVLELGLSDFYKDCNWKARCSLVLSALQWKCEKDVTSGCKIVYPIFHFKTYGSIILKNIPYTTPEGVIPIEKRMAIVDATLFEGLEQPAKRRKKAKDSSSVSSNSKKTSKTLNDSIVFEKEVLSDEEIKGTQLSGGEEEE